MNAGLLAAKDQILKKINFQPFLLTVFAIKQNLLTQMAAC